MPLQIRQWHGQWFDLDLTAQSPVIPPGTATVLGHIGDSLTFRGGNSTLQTAYENAGWEEVRVSGVDGRFVWDATDTGGGTPAVVNSWQSDGFQPTDLVVALGTNDTIFKSAGAWAAEFTNFRSNVATKLPSVERIWWVNIIASPGYNPGGPDSSIGANTVASWNTYLANNLASGEQILDWNTYVKANLTSNTYWSNDAIHMTTAGYNARISWLAANVPQN